MKRLFLLLLCVTLVWISVCHAWAVDTKASEALPSLGDNAVDLDLEALNNAGYKIVDNTDASITYTWPYNLDGARFNSQTAIGGTFTSQLGQVSGTITYFFSGTYLAVLFAEHHYAADITVNIDGVSYTAENPQNFSAPKGDAEGGISRVVFIKDDLEEGEHTVTISHQAGHNSGEDNIKGDGNKYYDNVAVFDAFIIKESESESADGLTVGKNAVLYDEATLDALDIKIIDDTDPNIIYAWPYDLDTAKITHGTALGQTAHWNIGQVGASITMIFEGSVLGVAFCETYFASKVIIDVDGEVVGEFIPHTDIRSSNPEIAYASKVFFVTKDLSPGIHILTITHETAYESGEDNLKADGNKYYDNNAYFDCIFVQKTPDDPSDNPPIIEDTTAEDTTVADTTVEDTTVEDTTVASVETTATPIADTTASPVSETTATLETTTELESDNGCKSSISLGSSAVAVATAAGVLLTQKRRHDDE